MESHGKSFGGRGRSSASNADENLRDLDKAKNRVFRAFEETSPSKFRTFFKSSKYDKFLHSLILYFNAFFQHQALLNKRESVDDYVIEATEAEAKRLFEQLGSIYAQIILTQSGCTHIQQDRIFWESLYEATDQVLQETFVGQKKASIIEIELGRIFRTRHFNTAARRHEMKRDPTNYSVRELYALKNEGDPVLNSRILSSIYSKHKSNSVQVAALFRSPLIEQLNIGSQSKINAQTASIKKIKDGKDATTTG